VACFQAASRNDPARQGVDDVTIQGVLRHSDVSVTRRSYIKALPSQHVAAINALENALCPNVFPSGPVDASATVN